MTYHLCLRFVCKLNLRRTRFTPELQTAFARLLPKRVQEHSTKVKEKECDDGDDDDDDDDGDDVDDDGDGEDDDYLILRNTHYTHYFIFVFDSPVTTQPDS